MLIRINHYLFDCSKFIHFFCTCRHGTEPVTKEFKVLTGVKLTKSSSLSTKFHFEVSLKASLSSEIPGLKGGMETTLTLSTEISSSVSKSDERSWIKEAKTKFTAPAGKKYRVLQTVVNFSSKLSADDTTLYASERIEESD